MCSAAESGRGPPPAHSRRGLGKDAHGVAAGEQADQPGRASRELLLGLALLQARGRGMPTALAPFIIRWGSEASGDVLRRGARRGACGGRERNAPAIQHVCRPNCTESQSECPPRPFFSPKAAISSFGQKQTSSDSMTDPPRIIVGSTLVRETRPGT
jgi:hypothetical protein